MNTRLSLQLPMYGEPCARANEWGIAARNILAKFNWTDDEIAAIANAWHPGLVKDGVPVLYAREADLRPLNGNMMKGHPALYVLWEQSRGKVRNFHPAFSELQSGTPRAHFRLVSAVLLHEQCQRLSAALTAKREGEHIADSVIWRALYWAARFHANICWTEAGAAGELARGGGRPPRRKSAATSNQNQRKLTVAVRSDALRIQGVPPVRWASVLAAELGVTPTTVRAYLNEVRPGWHRRRK